MTTETAIKDIPLNQLTAWEGNVRKSATEEGITELAASIKEHGLQQNLVVKKDGKKFAVVSGGRRLMALQKLLADKHIPATFAVPCKVQEQDDAQLIELSLVENTVREQMNPADEFEAFRKLIDAGKTVTDVAARFGKDVKYVLKLLKLALVSPAIIAAYRSGKLTLDQLMAFTVSDDHKAQERVFKSMGWRNDPDDIRDALTEGELTADNKLVKFVGIKGYEKAGGKLRSDLFNEGPEHIYILNKDILDTLVVDKLEKKKGEIEKEGWKWVEIVIDNSYSVTSRYQRIEEKLVPHPDAIEKELKKLNAEKDKLVKEYNSLEDAETDSPEDKKLREIDKRMDEIEARVEEIEEKQEKVFAPDDIAIAGVIISIERNGKLLIERGFLKAEDARTKKAAKKKAADDIGEETDDGEDDAEAEFSAGLIEDLTAEKSAALSARLIDSPNVALAAVMYTMALDTLEHINGGYGETCLSIRTSDKVPSKNEDSKAYKAIEAARKQWTKILPKDADKLWKWCLDQKTQTLLDLMAFCAAVSVDAVQRKTDRADSDRIVNAGKLAAALKLDMSDWFTPTAENFFSRVSKPQIVEYLKEIGKGNLLDEAKAKKSEAAHFAASKAEGSGWLPSILRAK